MSRRRELDEFVERSRGLYRRATLDAAAVEALEALEARGLRPLLLKGPALARALYDNRGRGYSDVDLLVGPHDLAPAREALAVLGYRHGNRALGIDDVAGIQHAETWARRVRGFKSGGPVLIDLHWRLAGCEVPAEVVWELLGARRSPLELAGRPVSVMSQEGLAFHVATHAAQHGADDLKAMADLTRGLEQWPSSVWRAAADLAEALGALPSFAAGLRLSAAGEVLVRQLELPSGGAVEWAIEHRHERPRGTFHLDALARARGPRERINVLRRSLFPTREWIAWHYPWAAAGRPRLVAAYARHVLRAPLWAARAWHYRRRARRAGGG